MDSTMQDAELLVTTLLQHGARVHPDSRVLHYQGGDTVTHTFADIADEAARLAGGLRGLGVRPDDVIATLCWNTPAHLAAYFAVPGMGAVLHTLNLRLSDEQLVYIINHAGDSVVIVDDDLVGQLGRVLSRCPQVQDVIVVAGSQGNHLLPPDGVTVHDYASLLAAAAPVIDWPQLAERSAAVLCYTTGTTGDPKGVAYSHRSIYLHSLAISTGSAFGFSDADRVMPMVPMFHANAWGWPYAAWINGADLMMTDRYLQAEHLARMITEQGVTAAAAVPTLWSALDAYGLDHPVDYSTLRLAVAGGSSLSAVLADRLAAHHGVQLSQGWGMTETSPLLTFSRPPHGTSAEQVTTFTTRSGRLIPGVQARVVDEYGAELPWDGTSIGEVELRGPTITGTYFRTDRVTLADKFRDGWLRTGDLGVIHPAGWVELKDRLKDSIKSGGEWISSVELEAAVAAHPAVDEVAVIGIADPRWDERPLVCVKLLPGQDVSAEQLLDFLSGRVSRWWLPENWTFVTQLPKTSVGKLDKKQIRADFSADRYEILHPRVTAATPSG